MRTMFYCLMLLPTPMGDVENRGGHKQIALGRKMNGSTGFRGSVTGRDHPSWA